MRILLADDSPVARMFVSKLLSKWGHEVVTAEDGAEAAGFLEGGDPPDVALLDWEMPRLTGPEVCARVRAGAEKGKVGKVPYLILLSARERDEDASSGLGAGADDYLTKPFQPDELRERIEKAERAIGGG